MHMQYQVDFSIRIFWLKLFIFCIKLSWYDNIVAEELGIKELVPPYLDPDLQISDLLTGVSFASGVSGYDPSSAKLEVSLSILQIFICFEIYRA